MNLPPEIDSENLLDAVDYEKAINNDSEESIQILIDLGEKEFNKLDKSLALQLIEIFEILMPGNGEIATILWSSAVLTAKGKPNMGIIKGDPGQGKTVLMEYILDFIPKRHIERINDATEASLFDDTKPIDYLDKKIVYLGDLGDKRGFEKTLAARKVLRTLQTDGEYSRKISEKQKDEHGVQNWKTTHKKLSGKPAAWWTSVREDADMQDQDRAIIATTNLEKEDEIKYIIQHMGKTSKTDKIIKETKENWIPKIHAIFEYLLSLDIEAVIPWNLQDMDYKFRDLNRLISLSEMMAIINLNYRKIQDEFVIVQKEDIELIARFLDEGKGQLPKTVIKRLIEVYNKYPPMTKFTRDDVAALFPDTYDSAQKGRSNVYRDILKPVLESFNILIDKGTKNEMIENLLLVEEKDVKPYEYYFKALAVDNKKSKELFIDKLNGSFSLDLPPIDERMLQEEYGIILMSRDDEKDVEGFEKFEDLK